jgi:hypothetical protein
MNSHPSFLRGYLISRHNDFFQRYNLFKIQMKPSKTKNTCLANSESNILKNSTQIN